jgi:hypothetical protein
VTKTIPSATGKQVQVIGYSVTPDIIYFDPDSTTVEI